MEKEKISATKTAKNLKKILKESIEKETDAHGSYLYAQEAVRQNKISLMQFYATSLIELIDPKQTDLIAFFSTEINIDPEDFSQGNFLFVILNAGGEIRLLESQITFGFRESHKKDFGKTAETLKSVSNVKTMFDKVEPFWKGKAIMKHEIFGNNESISISLKII